MNHIEKRQNPSRSVQAGFTLVELMVTISILGILAALAAPSFSDSIKRYRVNAIKDDLIASMQIARSEAIRRGLPVFLIRTTNCGATLTTSEWTCGWSVVVDTDSNGTASAAELATPIQISTVPIGYDVVHPGRGIQMIFNRWGQMQGVGERLVITNSDDGIAGAATTTACISSGGRIREVKGAVTCP